MKLWNDVLFVAGTTEGAMVSTNRGSFDGYLLALDPGDLELAADFPPAEPFVLSMRNEGGGLLLSWPARKGFDYQVWSSTDLDRWIPQSEILAPSFGFRAIETQVPSSLVRSNTAVFIRVEESPLTAAPVGEP